MNHSISLLWRQYLVTFCLGILVTTALTLAVNITVDPYNLLCSPCVSPRIGESRNQRAYKMFGLLHSNPDRLVLGTSRVDYGINGRNFGEHFFYNGGLSDAHTGEIYSFIRAAHKLNPLKDVVLFLDLSSLEEFSKTRDNFRLDLADPLTFASLPWFYVNQFLKGFFTLDALTESLRISVAGNMTCVATRVYGQSQAQDKICEASFPDRSLIFHRSARSLAESVYGREGAAHLKSGLRHLEALLEYCRTQRIDLTVLLPPVHEEILRQADALTNTPAYRLWKSEVRHIIDRSRQNIWHSHLQYMDLMSISDVTDEPVSDQMKFWWEASHFKPNVGHIIAEKIYSQSAAERPAIIGEKLKPTYSGGIFEMDAKRTFY